MLEQLVHNGVIVPEPPQAPGLYILVRGERVALTPHQEEMALAWAKKKDTEYVKDEVFVENFLRDFSRALGIDPPLTLSEVDFRAYEALVDEERRQRDALSKEERKALAAERKQAREDLKARYGYAIVNGQRVELGTYMVEPSGIFMGRGKHPLRGRWKQGASQQDITLNYGPNPEEMQGDWDEVLWQPDSMWVVRWKDKLTDKLKYIWLSDTAPIKQRREARKFDEALRLDKKLRDVRAAIQRGLVSDNGRTRMVATACYLIDMLCLRVGDEKEADEADTVGATTLRPEHVTLHEDGSVEFRFLGKDSVEWHRTLELPEIVYDNLADLIMHARPSNEPSDDDDSTTRCLPRIFPDISSRDVNAFLSDIMPGLSAKMFRTYHATKVVEHSLNRARIKPEHPEHRKWKAANVANLKAAQLCNHTKQVRGSWEKSRDRYQQRIKAARERLERYRKQVKEYRLKYEDLKQEAKEKEAAAKTPEQRKKVRQRYQKRYGTARRRIQTAMDRRSRAQEALGKVKAQYAIAREKREWNVATSLRSYIDPRVYYRWGQKVDYDVINNFYTATLRRKFNWVQHVVAEDEISGELDIRPCMPSDLGAVVHLLKMVFGDDEDHGIPLDREAVKARFLPDLEDAWREAVIALGSDDEIVAFGALGPVREIDEQPLVDCLAVIHPDHRDEETVQSLAAELERRFDRFVVLHPRKRSEEPYALQPSSTDWYDAAPGVPEQLGLEPVAETPAKEPQNAGAVELETAGGS